MGCVAADDAQLLSTVAEAGSPARAIPLTTGPVLVRAPVWKCPPAVSVPLNP